MEAYRAQKGYSRVLKLRSAIRSIAYGSDGSSTS